MLPIAETILTRTHSSMTVTMMTEMLLQRYTCTLFAIFLIVFPFMRLLFTYHKHSHTHTHTHTYAPQHTHPYTAPCIQITQLNVRMVCESNRIILKSSITINQHSLFFSCPPSEEGEGRKGRKGPAQPKISHATGSAPRTHAYVVPSRPYFAAIVAALVVSCISPSPPPPPLLALLLPPSRWYAPPC